MQTLGISDSSVRTESRIKSLFWPSIQSGADVEYLAVQGYWVCTLVAALSLAIMLATGQPIVGFCVLLLFHLGGIGVREHSRFAATIVFVFYVVDWLASPGSRFSVLRIFITALLLSNFRATWVAAKWRVGSAEAELPPRFHETWRDKFVDEWPAWFWPKIKVVYYIFSIGLLALVILGLAVMSSRAANH